MAYLTVSELEDRMKPDLVDRSDNTQKTDAINTASSMIDGYLEAAGYSVPVTSPPDLILKLCADIARYEVAKYTGLSGIATKDSIYYQENQDALKFLIDVQKGLAKIPGLTLPGGSTDSGSPARPIIRSDERRGW